MTSNTKKRRAYCDEAAPAQSVPQDLSHSSAVSPHALSLSAQQQYILEQAPSTQVRLAVPLSKLLALDRPDHQHYLLEQAASALDVPFPTLLDLSSRQSYQLSHLHKRPRLQLESNMPNSSSYSDDAGAQQDGHEKSPLAGPSDHVNSNARRSFSVFPQGSFSSGWTGTRLADCFASISMCQPCSSYEAPLPGYQPVFTTSAAYDYGSTRPVLVDSISPLQPHTEGPLVSTSLSSDHTGLYPCDDPAIVAQYLATYPSLQPNPVQPTRTMGMQPVTSREEMVYPGSSPASRYGNHDDNIRSATATGLGIQDEPHLISPPVRTSAMSAAAFTSEVAPPAFGRQDGFVGNPPRYNALQNYGVKGDPEVGLGRQQGGATNFDPFPNHRMLPARRGPFKDSEQREKTAHTRKIGSCIRCRMQRIRCNFDPANEGGPCLSCKKIASNSKIYRLNCLRWKITDVRLYKPGQVKGYEWTRRWKDSVLDDIGNWAAPESRIIRVTEGYTGKSVELQVRRFLPQEGDKLDRSWVSNGVKKSVSIPPYAIVDMEAAKSAFDEYIRNGVVDCCKQLLGPREQLLWQTYALALKSVGDSRTAESEKRLLHNTLNLWMSVRLTTKSFEIVGEDLLDMYRDLIQDPDNSLYGKIPLPPVMGAQIDSVLIHQVQPQLRRRTLEELQKMTADKKQRTWLTTYLVTLILLHNIGLITRHDAEYAKKHGMKRRFAREENVKEYNQGANILLAYFHYCNRGVYPFSAECKDKDLESLAQLDTAAISFVRYTRRFAADHKKQWQELWEADDYENEYYYVCQLFHENWQPRAMA
ncbi:hypothetical protein QBC46DRAFT_38398 [Diplogelasinospora grovesii]|uniref:Zn(2)-C6 fungal-type domain-containing protein n=1 Tax=Diplogelasinospora grovesii TaxID=303347 RepID=A0AAN6MYQ6_9PEZI|nr:hypothetical protein QBC46DRAFT_38398 [Diplogelasinospora grovesii]